MENEENNTTRTSLPWARIAVALSGGVVLVWLGLLTWQVRTAPAPVTFDMRRTVDTFTEQTADRQLSDADKDRLVARFNDALTASLTAWAETHHRPVLVKAAVVSGVEDITGDIQRDIARRMRQGEP
ncbi:type-F conjugative transfer system protein TrbI (plasmid) [Klebsiella michiganensis]|uniref:Type-F conjugative transfer system protein TrbI n=1 Tax=Klebsiella michiganensis TaxID=1134687 RepID=A0A6P1V5N8_9ENTR|nr:type-F conjugative transfer system protein TrbI [Klebsiella michiganensis]QHS50023.1 type-F conjugative transfer system protein TrbI [Klebsiella michiganensis]